MNSPQQQDYATLGKLAWLWMGSPLQREWPLEMGQRMLQPPVALRQCMVIEREGLPVGYCSWAWLDAEAERRYLLRPNSLRAQDWQSGDRLWVIDFVAPFGARDTHRLSRAFAARFADQVARAVRRTPDGQGLRVLEFKGREVSAEKADRLLAEYYLGFFSDLRQRTYRTPGRRREAACN